MLTAACIIAAWAAINLIFSLSGEGRLKNAAATALLIIIIIASTGIAWAACTISTFTQPDGRVVVCERCCDNRGNCYTTCN